MKNTNLPKHPLALSVLFAFVILLFPIAAGVTIQIRQSSDIEALLLQALFFALAFGVALLISKALFKKLALVGLQAPKSLHTKRSLYFIPLVAVEVLPLFFGLQTGLTLATALATLLLTFFVALAEETFFRGIILSLLAPKGAGRAVLLSSLLFSLGHFSNLAGGAALLPTLLQVAFAFAFGAVAALLALSTRSLLLPILLHFVHNSIAYCTTPLTTSADTLLASVQTLLLLGYALYLWNKNKA